MFSIVSKSALFRDGTLSKQMCPGGTLHLTSKQGIFATTCDNLPAPVSLPDSVLGECCFGEGFFGNCWVSAVFMRQQTDMVTTRTKPNSIDTGTVAPKVDWFLRRCVDIKRSNGEPGKPFQRLVTFAMGIARVRFESDTTLTDFVSISCEPGSSAMRNGWVSDETCKSPASVVVAIAIGILSASL
jgi:hypothetical protein